jgi:hypothetical protein
VLKVLTEHGRARRRGLSTCGDCFTRHFYPDEGEVPHPPYSDEYVECAVCGAPLYNDDN